MSQLKLSVCLWRWALSALSACGRTPPPITDQHFQHFQTFSSLGGSLPEVLPVGGHVGRGIPTYTCYTRPRADGSSGDRGRDFDRPRFVGRFISGRRDARESFGGDGAGGRREHFFEENNAVPSTLHAEFGPTTPVTAAPTAARCNAAEPNFAACSHPSSFYHSGKDASWRTTFTSADVALTRAIRVRDTLRWR